MILIFHVLVLSYDYLIYAYETGLIGRTKKVIQKKVARYDLDGTNEKIYESITEAAKDTGISDGSIPRVCKGERNKAGGYKWAYVN